MVKDINVADRVVVRRQAIKEFEAITEMAELRALSKLSLETPLNDSQFNRMIELKNKLLGAML